MSYCSSRSFDNLSLISFFTSRRLSTSFRISVGKMPVGNDESGKSGRTSSPVSDLIVTCRSTVVKQMLNSWIKAFHNFLASVKQRVKVHQENIFVVETAFRIQNKTPSISRFPPAFLAAFICFTWITFVVRIVPVRRLFFKPLPIRHNISLVVKSMKQ